MIKKSEKPLFIPLKAKYFDQFLEGTKKCELRKYGTRWNENTCHVGRKVILSRGYGKSHRLDGVINDFDTGNAKYFMEPFKSDIKEIYGTDDVIMAVITIGLSK